MDEWVWSNGGMILTGKTEVLGEKHYTAWVVDWWMSMEQWWNDTDRGKLKFRDENISQCHLNKRPWWGARKWRLNHETTYIRSIWKGNLARFVFYEHVFSCVHRRPCSLCESWNKFYVLNLNLYFLLFWPYGWMRDMLVGEYCVAVYGRNRSQKFPA